MNCCGGFSINSFVIPAGMTEKLIEARRQKDVSSNAVAGIDSGIAEAFERTTLLVDVLSRNSYVLVNNT